MAVFALTADGGLDIAGLQQLVQDKEVILGALLNVNATEAGGNQLSFHGVDSPADIPPDGKGIALEIAAGHPRLKRGSTLICFGAIFVQGELKPVAAYRPV